MAQAVTPLVGRADEVRALLDLVAGPPAVVRVVGDAGVGKTRLIEELLAHPALRGRRKLVGTCQSLREPLPLAPLVDALLSDDSVPWTDQPDPVLGALVPLLPELGPRLPAPAAPPDDPRMERHRRYRALRHLLALAGPAVLVLDDFHWTDDATVEFLRFLVGHLPPDLALVLSHRPGERSWGITPPRSGVATGVVRLEPLSITETAAMAHAVARSTGPAPAAALLRLTGGLPFAIEEVVRAAIERAGPGAAPWETLTGDSSADNYVSDGYLELIGGRLAPLDGAARGLVTAAAVLGVPTAAAELCAVAEVRPEVGEDALDRLVVSRLLQESDGRYRCTHDLAGHAVIRTLTPSALRNLHRRAAAVLQAAPGEPRHMRVGHHLKAAGEHAAWRRSVEAGVDRAIVVGDTGAALAALRELLDTTDDLAERRRLAVKLGPVALYGLDFAVTEQVLRGLLATVGLPVEVRGELRKDLGLLLVNQAGDAAAGYRELEAAVGELRASRPDLAARVMSCLASTNACHQHVRVGLRWLREADALAETLVDPVARFAFLVNKASALLECGRPEAWSLAEEVLATPADFERGQHLVRACFNFAEAACWLGHYRRAGDDMVRGRELAREFAAPFTEEHLGANDVLLDWLRGDWQGLRERAAAADHVELPRIAAGYRLVAGALAAEAGDSADALRLLRGLVAGTPPAPPVAAAAYVLVAESRHRGPIRAEPVPELDAALEVVRRTGMWVWAAEVTPVAVDLLCRVDRFGAAEDLLEEHAEGVRDLDCPAADAALVLGRAVLGHRRGDLDAALAGYAEAEAAFAAMPRRFWWARARLGHGECALAAGQDGVHLVRDAEAVFVELGATVRVRHCHDVLRAHQALPTRKRGRPAYGDRLSPREREVAGLAAASRSNREIASSLGLSVRTVELHVAAVLQKLRVGSRVEIAAVLADATADR
ncbi:LuxR family transcriptional regulator [Actinokineospora sp. NBRC 105648]|uniref:ATP-binding protein n=1 Tax=Actinokineospora sp. NBRC 105648 TaxID=3032206 RepID=UPI0024A37B6F|nr:LuxR family transcriptional regulator [Actinokineospora sp. NBRC 105648]GLZ42212.1 LuxR family transcriptional regulator [Actinokineospora sp. NBRC 105648]